MVLTLSHGQASVERDFRVNKSMLVENLSTESLVSQRMVYDHMKVNALNAEDVEITPQLRQSVKGATQRYLSHLGEKKMAKVRSEKTFKRKAVQDEIIKVNRKKAMLETSIEELRKDADKYAIDAEKVCKIEEMKILLSKSNSFRRTVKEKEDELKDCQYKIKELLKKKEIIV